MKTEPQVLGRAAIAAITAVEGLALSEAGRLRQAEFDRAGLSSAERLAAIAKAYRPASK
jgi:hypothetical protein